MAEREFGDKVFTWDQYDRIKDEEEVLPQMLPRRKLKTAVR